MPDDSNVSTAAEAGLLTPTLGDSRINIHLNEIKNPNENAHARNCGKFITLITPEHFVKILDTCSTQQALIEKLTSQTPASITTMLRQPTVTPAYCSNAENFLQTH
jgi:hypothetical protein